MGMHFGLLVADVPSSRLVAVLEELAPAMVDQGPIASLDEIEPAAEEGWELAVGDLGDRSCIFDGTYMLSSDADLVARVAATTGGLVIGCGAETVSGTFFLAVARGDTLLRNYQQCYSDLEVPYSAGAAVPGEVAEELDDIDGSGLLAVLAAHGFDFDRWVDAPGKRKLRWNETYLATGGPPPWAGAETRAFDQHRAAHKLAPEKVPPIGVQVRVVGAAPKKPWWRFW